MYTDFRDQNGNPVSAATVIAATKKPIIKHETLFEIFHKNQITPFTFVLEDDYIRESLIISNSCGSDGIKLGSVNIGQAKFIIKNAKVATLRSPDTLIDTWFPLTYRLEVDENTTAVVMGGVYYVKALEQLAEGVKLIAYDGMCKLDAPFSGALSGTPYQIITAAATACGVNIQSTQAEIEALPNGQRTFTLNEDNDCRNWRDVLSYLAQLMGCFVTFGRMTYGTATLPGILFKTFGGGRETVDDTITDVHRYKGAKFSLWDTAYAEFTLKSYALEDPQDPDSAKKMDFTYSDATVSTEGQTYDLGYNPFLQPTTPEAGLTQDQIAILHDLLEKVATYQYTPLQITLPVGFIYDLGDVIKCTGRLANTGFAGGSVDDAYGVILNETYTYGRDYRIKSLDSHAGKGRATVPYSVINVTVTNGTGATVKATDGVHTYTATESSGSATLTILAVGTYTITAELSGGTGDITDTVTVQMGGTYTAEVGFSAAYECSDANALLLELDGRYKYTKALSGLAYVAWFGIEYFASVKYGPLLVAEASNRVSYKYSQYSRYTYMGSLVTIGDKSWYVSYCPDENTTGEMATFRGSHNKTDGIAEYIGTFSSVKDAATRLLEIVGEV